MSAASSTPAGAAQVGAFYAGSPIARWMGRSMRVAQRVSPALALRLAMRLFFTPLPSKLAARARTVPAAWQREHLRFEHGRMALWRRAEPASGPTVLLVHGWAGDAMQLRAIGDALHEAGYAALLLDLPAHGRSDGWRSTLPQFVRALFAVQARVGPLHGVVAHSLGALAAVHAAARGLGAGRLALVSAPIPPAAFIRGFAQSFGLSPSLAGGMREAIQRLEGVPLAQFEPAWLGERVTQPTLLLHDRDDRAAPVEASKRLAQALAGARLELTAGLGHRRILAEPAVAQAIVSHFELPTAAHDGHMRTHAEPQASAL